MFSILLLGSGKSASYLVKRLAQDALKNEITFSIADISFEHLHQYLSPEEFAACKLLNLNLENEAELLSYSEGKNLIISMLPAFLHLKAARIALAANAHFFTASYVSEEMKALSEEAKAKNLCFLNECGLDPGIDHISAVEIIEKLNDSAAEIESFLSFTGGLVAPESDDNPWGYKFSWNPRNVVVAGQSTAKYLEGGLQKFIPYHKLFQRTSSWVFNGIGEYEGYANRDSLAYKEVYQLHNIKTLLRGTLRKKGYCSAWNIFVQLGLTDDSYTVHFPETTTLPDFLSAFLPENSAAANLKDALSHYLGGLTPQNLEKLSYLGFFNEQEPLPMFSGTPAQILQAILEPKWKLNQADKDMILMAHKFTYFMEGKRYELHSEMSVVGEDNIYTAMAKTVSLPLYIASRMLRNGEITQYGVILPVHKQIYKPMLKALEAEGIHFIETIKEI